MSTRGIATPEALAAGEVDVDGLIDDNGIEYKGSAQRQPDGTWRCLAVVGRGALCLVEVRMSPVLA